MKSLRPALIGIVTALFSMTMVLGGLSLALAEGGVTELSLLPTNPPITPTLYIPPTALPDTPSPTPPPATLIPTHTSTTIPTDSCQEQPEGWVLYNVQDGDTLQALANRYAIPVEQVMQANCMVIPTLLAGTYIYLPPTIPSPTATATKQPTPTRTLLVQVLTFTITSFTIPCGPPPGWVLYTVQKDDTLYRLSQIFGVAVYQLQHANCMGQSIVIHLGSRIFVPFLLPSSTSQPTMTLTPKPTSTTISTSIPTIIPTTILTSIPTPVPSPSPTITPSTSPSPIPTQTQPPTFTIPPSATIQLSVTPESTKTLPPAELPTETNAPTGTDNAPLHGETARLGTWIRQIAS